jgi:hypothetical protein
MRSLVPFLKQDIERYLAKAPADDPLRPKLEAALEALVAPREES